MVENRKDFLVNAGFTAVVGGLIFIAFKFMFSYLLPFIIAFIIAYAVQRPASYLSSKIPLKRQVCALILSVFIFLVLISSVILFGYFSVIKAKDIFANINGILSEFSDIIFSLQTKLFNFLNNFSLEDLISDFTQNITRKITAFFSDFAGNFVKKTPSFIFSSVVTLVATCYIAKDFGVLAKFYRNLFGEKVYSNTLKIKTIISQSVFKILKGYLILMLLTFAQLALGFYALGVRYALVLAFLVSFVDLLPILGTGTVLIPWGLADVFLNNPRGFGILILYILVSLARNFAEPKIISNQIGINPLFTLISMFAGLRIFGFLGLILFPVALIVIIEYYKGETA